MPDAREKRQFVLRWTALAVRTSHKSHIRAAGGDLEGFNIPSVDRVIASGDIFILCGFSVFLGAWFVT